MRNFVQAGVVTALVLIVGSLVVSFIARARHEANRISCKNNLRMLGLSLHNYHDTAGRLPAGTKPADNLPPEQRWSWQFELIPYLYGIMDSDWHQARKRPGWELEENAAAVNVRWPVFLCQANPNQGTDNAPGLTH